MLVTAMTADETALDRLKAMIPRRDWIYRDAHYLIADFEVEGTVARRWLPPSLKLAEPARASIFLAWFPDNTFKSVYREAGLFLHVKHWGLRTIFSPWMIVDDDVALILGRELFGYPKKMGEITWSIEGDRFSGVATRRGTELVRMEGTLGKVLRDPPPMLGRPHRNVRSALGFAMPRIVAFTPREEILEARRADVRVTIGGSERDPLAELGFGKMLGATLYRVNLGGMLPPVPIGIVSPLYYARQILLRIH
jgi:acetoacetate decarboxylase